MTIDSRVGCSSITFRRLPLDRALETIAGLGFAEIDLGALPGVCDHVPYHLDDDAVRTVAATIAGSGLAVRSINGDIGDLNLPLEAEAKAERRAHLDHLLDLAEAVGSPALVLPCGSQGHGTVTGLEEDLDLVATELAEAAAVAQARGLQLWVESLHSGRLCFDLERAGMLTRRLDGTGVGVVMDFSHVVASGGDPLDFVSTFGAVTKHVHVRDAVPGDIHLTPGNGDVDFAAGVAALRSAGYDGHFSLELETRDVVDDERPQAAERSGRLISALLQ